MTVIGALFNLNHMNADQEHAKKAGFKQGRTFDRGEVSHKVSLEVIEEKIEREQAKGLRETQSVGVPLSPSALLRRLRMSLECRRALPGETEVPLVTIHNGLNLNLPPPVWVASAVIGQVASRRQLECQKIAGGR